MPDTPMRPRPSWILPAMVLVLVATLIATIVATNWGGSATGGASAPQAAGAPVEGAPEQTPITGIETRDANDLLTAGPVDAPVVLVVFSDYQCPFCARWSKQTLPSMMKHVEAGDLRIEWRDVNVFGPASERAARASYAAAKQGAFWQYHEKLFANGERRSEDELSDQALLTLATELGLDPTTFAADYSANETAKVIAANEKFGFDLGVTSTPVFVLGGRPIVGAQPTQVFEETFVTALEAAK